MPEDVVDDEDVNLPYPEPEDGDGGPEEPLDPFLYTGIPTLSISAVALHEWVVSLQDAGFSRSEAIHICVELLKGAL